LATLLLVDDDKTLLEVLFELFSLEHECDTAATAEEAFELLRSREYDLVVTDISMPGMGGEVLLGFVKTNSPGTPVIFISGSKDSEIAKRLRVKGANGFLSKPFDLAEIREKVGQALEGRRRS
jgi:DNA-binding NtrC family response regulator